MNKEEYLKELDLLVSAARKEAWEVNQDEMINDFEAQEKERLELFTASENMMPRVFRAIGAMKIIVI